MAIGLYLTDSPTHPSSLPLSWSSSCSRHLAPPPPSPTTTPPPKLVDASALGPFLPTAKQALDEMEPQELVARCLARQWGVEGWSVLALSFRTTLHPRPSLTSHHAHSPCQRSAVTPKALRRGHYSTPRWAKGIRGSSPHSLFTIHHLPRPHTYPHSPSFTLTLIPGRVRDVSSAHPTSDSARR